MVSEARLLHHGSFVENLKGTMSDWNFLNRCRIGLPGYPDTDESWGFNGAFLLRLSVSDLKVIASDGEGWQHVSVSRNNEPNIPPSWTMMCRVKDLFWEPEDVVMQLHPAKSQYVNYHPGCLHLWRPTKAGVVIPTPPMWMIGPKS